MGRGVPENKLGWKDLRNNPKIIRGTNPLDPTYTVDGEKGKQAEQIGFVDGSRPALHGNAPALKNKGFSSLNTSEISGAIANSRGLGVFANRERRTGSEHFSQGLLNSDIHGANCGSRKIGITSKRCINPLTGDYQMPGHTEKQDVH
jgi:hypothetical protein